MLSRLACSVPDAPVPVLYRLLHLPTPPPRSHSSDPRPDLEGCPTQTRPVHARARPVHARAWGPVPSPRYPISACMPCPVQSRSSHAPVTVRSRSSHGPVTVQSLSVTVRARGGACKPARSGPGRGVRGGRRCLRPHPHPLIFQQRESIGKENQPTPPPPILVRAAVTLRLRSLRP